jgi:hypothetical protein
MFTRSLGRKIVLWFVVLSLLIGQGAVLPATIHAKGPDWTKIDQALQDAMAKNPYGKFDVIVEMKPDTDPGHGDNGNGKGKGNGNAHGHAKRAGDALDLIRQNGGEAGNSLAGNHGPGSSSISTPGHDPFIITVGSIDDKGTPNQRDDDVPYFSARGPTLAGDHKPDILAPGRKIISLYALNSYLDGALPGRQMFSSSGRLYFRLTGTSMAAPVVSGVVALLLQKNPDLTPDQVKYILTKTAPNFPGSRDTVSAGVVDAYAALTSDKMGIANRGIRPSDSFARQMYDLIYGQPLSWKDPHYMGIDWENLAWDNLAWDNLAWDAGEWDSINEAGFPWESLVDLD